MYFHTYDKHKQKLNGKLQNGKNYQNLQKYNKITTKLQKIYKNYKKLQKNYKWKKTKKTNGNLDNEAESTYDNAFCNLNMLSVLFYFTKGSKGKQVGMPSCNKTAFFIRFQRAF